MPAYRGEGGSGGGGGNTGVDWNALQKRLEHYTQAQAQNQHAFDSGHYNQMQDVGPAPTPQQFPSVIQRPGVVDWATLQNKLQAATTAVPDRAQAALDPNFGKLMGDRMSKVEIQYWKERPYLWGQIVTSRYRERTIDNLFKHIPAMDDWIRGQNVFGGVSGGLVQLRGRALRIPDPYIRAQALQEVDALAALSPDEQQAFLAQANESGQIAGNPRLEDGGHFAKQPDMGIEQAGANAEPTALEQGLGQLLGDQFAGVDETGKVQLHAKVGAPAALSPLQQEAMQRLFPDLMSAGFGRVVSPTDVVRSVYESQGFQGAYDATLGKYEQNQSLLGLAEAVIGAVGVGGGAVFGTLGKAGSEVLRHGPASLIGGSSVANLAGAGVRRMERYQNNVSDFIGNAADTASYTLFNHHLSEDTQQFLGNVGLIVALHEAGEAAGALKTTLTGPAEFTQGEIGFEGGTYADVLRGAAKDPVAAAVHPFSTFLDPIVQQSIYNVTQMVHSTALEDWITRAPATKFFGYIQDQVDTLGRNDALASITERYPVMSRNPGWAEDLVDTAAHGGDLGQATVDFAQHVGYKDAAVSLDQNAADMADVQSRIDAGAEGVDPAADVVQFESGHVPTPEEIASAEREGRPIKFQGYHGNAEGPTTPTVEGGGGLSSYAFDPEFSRSYAGGLAENVTEHTLYANKVWDFRAEASSEVKSSLLETLQQRGVDVDSPQWGLGGKQVTVRGIVNEAQTVADLDKVAPYIGPRAVASMQDLVGATEGGAPGGFGGVNPSDIWMRDTLKNMGYDGEIRPDLNEAGAGWEFRAYRDLYEPVGNIPTAALGELYDKLTDLKAERRLLQAHQTELYTRAASVYEFPTQRSLPDFLHRVLYRPVTIAERLTRAILNPLRTVKTWSNSLFKTDYFNPSDQAFVAKLVDKIGSEDRLKAPMLQDNPGARAAASDANVTYIHRLYQRFGVSEADTTASLSKLLNAKSAQDFWEVTTNDIFGKEGVLSKYLPKNTPKAWADSFLQRYDVNSFNLRGYNIETMPDGTQVYKPLLPGEARMGVPQSLPSAPSEFSSYVPLPSMGEIDRILSGYRRLAENLRHAERFSTVSNFAANALDFNRLILHLSTSVLKPIALLANLPAIIMTKQLDEALGNAMSPNIRGIMHAGKEADSLVGPIDPAITGNAIAGGFYDNPSNVPVVGEVATRDILQNGVDSQRAALVWNTRAEQLNGVADDYFMSQFARDGFDVTKFRARLEGGDPVLTRHYQENLLPQLERSTLKDEADPLGAYLPRLENYIREVTFDHPDYLEYVRSGHMAPGGTTAGRTWKSDINANLAARWTDLQQEQGLVREALSKLDREADAPAIRAHQARLKDLIEETNDVEAKMTEFGGVAKDKVALITRERPQALANDIKDRFNNGEVNLPDTVKVNTGTRVDFGGTKNSLEFADEIASKMSQWIYGRDGVWSFRRIGEFEGKYARGSYFEQRALQYAKGFRASGMSEADALEFGRLRAGVEAKDIFYDLTARSTTERALRNVFWFAPVNSELLYRWLYAIPAQSGGLIPGAFITAARAGAWVKMLNDTGLVHDDPVTGQKVLGLSGLANFIERASGGKVKMPDILELPLASLNPHLSSPIPQLAPLPALALNKAAGTRFGTYAPVLKDLSNLVAPNAYTTVVPSSIRNAMAIFGVKVPDFSPDYINQQWDRTHDIALQYAYNDLQHQGILAPKYEDYKNQDAYLADWNTWFDQLNQTANQYSKGLYVVSTLSSAVLPGYLVASDPDKQAYQKWYTDKIQPQIALDNGTTSDATRSKMNRWLGAHPESLAYSISYGYYTGKEWQPDLAKTDSEYYTQLYLHGVKGTMDPEKYGQVLAAMTSKSYYDAKLQGQLNQIAPDNSPATMLRNWGQRTREITKNRIAWQNYKMLHPEVDGILKENQSAMEAQYGIPVEDIQRQYVQSTLLGLQALSNAFTGEDKLPITEYRTTISKLKELNAQLYTSTGGKLTPMEEGISWYFDNVLSPYFDKTNHLYEQANNQDAAGLSTTATYQQIDAIKAKYQNLTHNGEKYPSVDEFFYGTKSPTQQKYAVTSWMTKPVSWLSDWQRQKVGYPSFNGEDTMFKRIASLDTDAQNFIEKNQISPGSNWYDAVKASQARQEAQIAQDYGKQGLDALKLEQASPYVRLQYFGYGSQNQTMQNVYKMVDYATHKLNQADVSPTGYSQYAIDAKLWLYDYIAHQEQNDPEFLKLMQRLSFSTTPMQGAVNHPTGVPLWEAIFFGNYNPSFIPQSLIDSAPQGSSTI